MQVLLFNAQEYELPYLTKATEATDIEFVPYKISLDEKTVHLVKGYTAICCFVNDHIHFEVIRHLAMNGVKIIALRCAGFNNVDLNAAKQFKIAVVRVPAYSPYAVAEFAVGLILALNRKIIRAYERVREHNFLLSGLLGFDLHNRVVGIIGTGNIGSKFANIMHGFGCKIFAYDIVENEQCRQLGVNYVPLTELFKQSDIISLHCPLNNKTHYIINSDAIQLMKTGVMLINTGRGALIDTRAIITGLKQRKIGYLGIDVYEEEENLFFQDHSEDIIEDDVFVRLQTFPNVIITGHQAFFTHEALATIAKVTVENIQQFFREKPINIVNI